MTNTDAADLVTNTRARVEAVIQAVAEQHGLPGSFAPTDHLVDRGMTSMAMVDLMLAVEAEFDLTIPQGELTPTNFQSIEALTRMIERQ